MEDDRANLERRLLKTVSNIDKLFNDFNEGNNAFLNNYGMAKACYKLGDLSMKFKNLEFFKGNPDYEKAASRLEIIKNRLYREAQRRDKEEGKWLKD